MSNRRKTCRLVVLISGTGTNLQVILNQCADGELPARVVGVISNEPSARGLERAALAGIRGIVVDHRQHLSRESFDAALDPQIASFKPDLVILAGFMRVLGSKLVQRYRGRMLNIHPSLLPDYPGLDTHARAVADGVTVHGATVHFVTPQLDAGPVIVQGRVQVCASDTPNTLAQRVHDVEYQIYPLAIRWFAQGRLTLQDDCACLDGVPIRL